MKGMRVPRTPSTVPWVALGIAVAGIGYGLGVKAYKKVREKVGTRKKKEEPKADMQPEHTNEQPRASATTSTQEDKETHSKAPSTRSQQPKKRTASPAGHEEMSASKTAAGRGTQSTPRKTTPRKPVSKKKPAEVIDQTLNPKKTNRPPKKKA